MNLFSEPLVTQIVGSLVAIIGAVSLYVVGVLKNESLQETLVNYLARRLNKNVIDKKDLLTHELFIKTRDLIKNKTYTSQFTNPRKNILFNEYTTIFGEMAYCEAQTLIKLELEKLNLAELKDKVHISLTNIFNGVDKEFNEKLRMRNNNTDEVTKISNLIQEWRTDYQHIISENVFNVFVTSKTFNNEYILDKVFTVYCVGLDFLVKNGIETFNKLNGDLDNFLK